MNKEYIEQLLKVDGVYDVTVKSNVTFFHADNMAFLRWCKQEMLMGYWHIGIVDPPYGVDITKQRLGTTNASKPKEYKRGNWDGEVPTQEYWDLLSYVCRNVIVWGGNYFTKEVNFSGRCFVVWDKGSDEISFAPGELAITSFQDRNAVFIRKSRNKQLQDEGTRHDTQKPVYLYDSLHLNFVEKGWRVLDTHGGSFSHAIAAYKNNVNLTIMDKEKSYYENGIAAYQRAATPGRLAF